MWTEQMVSLVRIPQLWAGISLSQLWRPLRRQRAGTEATQALAKLRMAGPGEVISPFRSRRWEVGEVAVPAMTENPEW